MHTHGDERHCQQPQQRGDAAPGKARLSRRAHRKFGLIGRDTDFSHDTRYAFSRHSSLDTLPLPLDTLSLVTLQNTNCSRSPSTVDVLLLFLAMRGSTPSGPRPRLNWSF